MSSRKDALHFGVWCISQFFEVSVVSPDERGARPPSLCVYRHARLRDAHASVAADGTGDRDGETMTLAMGVRLRERTVRVAVQLWGICSAGLHQT